jgi:hypothetical protein
MTEALQEKSAIQWFEVDTPVRGCATSLKKIKDVYSELNELSKREADRILGALAKPLDKSEEEFAGQKQQWRADAFKLTVSIIGGDDNVTKYGETESIFASDDLPHPINMIFFTNENSFKRNANGAVPPNLFRLWLHFAKPPLFDPNPLVSEPTANASKVFIKANDLAYFRAAQSIINNKLKRNLWYAPINEKFAYDIGLWFVWAPYLLYTITIYADKWLPDGGQYHTLRPAFYIYGVGIGVVFYRSLYGYLKWAFPVNVLAENKDTATRHRVIFSGLVLAIFGNAISHFFGF